jgi:arylsulfatase A-like enzyme/cytochrome c-type biogenesis protein CcmH/NrfG
VRAGCTSGGGSARRGPSSRAGRTSNLRNGSRGAWALWTLLASIVACGEGAPPDSGPAGVAPPGIRDVLVVTLDTTRADRVSYAGASRVRTPRIDAVAAQGAAFLQAVTPVPVTLPAHASLFTGSNPPSHGVRSNGIFRLPPEETTLAELLRQAGFRTAAFVGAAVLDARFGLDQGFDHYDDAIPAQAPGARAAERRASEVVAAALDWLRRQPAEPTFVWVHLFDPHAPYDPPEPERSRYADAPYDGEIAYADRMLGRLLDGYRELGRWQRALVVITADHGESLGEHGEKTHGNLLYEATVRVPLVVRAPGHPASLRIEEPVGLVDVTPTVAALLGLEPPADAEGISLVRQLAGEEVRGEERLAYLETLYPFHHHGWSGLRGLRGARWKLIQGREPELYALDEDPAERHDLARERPERVAALAARLPAEPEPGAGEARVELDAATLAELQALGYAWSGSARERPEDELPDPRERIHLLEQMDAAILAFAEGHRGRGIELAERVVAAEPRSAGFLRELAHMYLASRRLAEAEATYARALARAPQDVAAWLARGAALRGLDRPQEALDAFERALELDPEDRAARHDRWATLLALGRNEEVRRRAEAALRHDPDDPEAAWAAIMAAGEPPAARARALERALAVAPGDPTLSFELGKTAEAQGDAARAEALYAEALSSLPSNTELRTPCSTIPAPGSSPPSCSSWRRRCATARATWRAPSRPPGRWPRCSRNARTSG